MSYQLGLLMAMAQYYAEKEDGEVAKQTLAKLSKVPHKNEGFTIPKIPG